MRRPFSGELSGWPLRRLDEVSQVNPPRELDGQPDDLLISKVPMAAVEAGTGRLDAAELVTLGEVKKKSLTHFREGDVVLAKISPSFENGKVALAAGLSNGYAVGTTELHVFRPSEDIDPRYLLHFLLSEDVRLPLARTFAGTVGQQRISLDELRAIEIPTPPRPVQHAIVEAIERTLSKVAAATSSVQSGKTRSTVLRGSALQLMIDSAKNLAEDLPLDAVWESANYGTSERCEVDGLGLPVLRIPNIRGRAVDFSEIKRVAALESGLASAVVAPDDVLIVRTNGSRSLIGRTAVVPTTAEPFACASYLIRIRPTADLVRAGFLAAALEAPSTRERIEALAASSAGQYNLSVAKLRKLSIPAPPLAVQDQLLEELAQRESMVTHADATLGRLTRRSAQLRRSVLKAAFEGRLTHNAADTSPQDFEQVPA